MATTIIYPESQSYAQDITESSASPALPTKRTWTCTICNRVMSETTKDHHVGGMKHLTQAAKLSDSLNDQSPVVSASRFWTCTTCNRVMNTSSKSQHIAGDRHQRKALRTVGSFPPDSSVVEASAPPTLPSPPPPPAPAPSLPSTGPPHPDSWTCTTCNLTMHINSQLLHLLSKKHRKLDATSASTAGSASSSSPPKNGLWRCVPCDQVMYVACKDAHLAGQKHLRREIVMPQTSTGPIGPISASSGAASGIAPSPPQSSSVKKPSGKSADRRRKGKKPSAGPVPSGPSFVDSTYDSDDSDDRGLLHDIDTAFGLLPHGGAYKESNHYDDYGDVMY